MVWHTLQDVFLLLFSLLFAWHKKKDSAIFRLNQDVLLMIFDYLSPVDQACFSLSCKRYYDLFGHVTTQRDEFKFPRLLEIKVPWLCVDAPEVERNQLLMKLEDRRWAYCSACLKLHPWREFPRLALKDPVLQRACDHLAGIVDLCPCISLTVRDRARAIKAIKSSPVGYELKGPLTVSVDKQRYAMGEPFLRHTCSINTHVDRRLVVETSIEMAISLDASDQLWVDTTYVSHYHAHRRIEDWAAPIFVCPHRDLFVFIRSSMYTSVCGICDCRIHWCPGKSNGKRPITVHVQRPLSDFVWPPDQTWSYNCRFVSRNFALYQDFWYT